MIFFQELVDLINKHKTERIEIIGNEAKSNSKLNQFYFGIKNREIQSDQDAIQLLYGSNGNRGTYLKLKSRFKDRLINSVFFLDSRDKYYTDIQKAFYKCYKNWAAIRILFGKSAKESAIILALKTIKIAIKFEFTEIIINLSRVLRLYYATVKGDKKKFTFYNNLLKKNTEILAAELKAEQYYEELLIEFANSMASKTSLGLKAQEYSDELKQYDNIETHSFLFFSYTIHVLRYEILNNHIEVINECQKATSKLLNKHYKLKQQLITFYLKEFSCHVKLGQYEKAKLTSTKCKEILVEGTVNWFKFYQLYFCFLCHIKEFVTITQIINKVLLHPRLKFQSQDTIETYKIISAYIYFLVKIGKINVDSSNRNNFKSKFKLGRFLNDLPAFNKDKRGGNIHILTIQTLIALVDKKYNFIIDCSTAFDRYTSRYLKKNETFRSNCFILILTQLPKSNFNKESFLRHTDKYLKMLKQAPLYSSNQNSEFEVIPYEDLITYVIELL